MWSSASNNVFSLSSCGDGGGGAEDGGAPVDMNMSGENDMDRNASSASSPVEWQTTQFSATSFVCPPVQ